MSERGDSANSKKEDIQIKQDESSEPTRTSQAHNKSEAAPAPPPVTNAQVYENTYRMKPERK